MRFEAAEHVRLRAPQPFWRFDSGSLEMELSPEHTVLYDDYRGVRRVATAAQCAVHPSRRTIPTTFALERPDLQLADAVIRLLVAFSADGHLPCIGFKATITLRKERKKVRLRQLLTSAGLAWKERSYPDRPTETIFVFSRRGMRKSLSWVWSLSSRQLAIVIDECTRWDGLDQHAERRYFTTIEANADAVQFAAHACGLRATIEPMDDPRSAAWRTMYVVAIRAGDNAKNHASIRETTRISRTMPTDGMKYCFTTSTGFFVARCNKTVFVTGNSGKTSGNFFKLAYMARLQAPSADGIRRTRAVIVRNTAPQLRDTTLASWNYWFKDGEAGDWIATAKNFILRFGGDVECEVLFRALDSPEDIARVLSLEVTFAIIDEFVQIPRAIVDALSARCGRYPPPSDVPATNYGMWGSSNPDTEDCWWFDFLENNPAVVERVILGESDEQRQIRRLLLPGEAPIARYFRQPSALGPAAENIDNLPGKRKYYENQIKGKTDVWIKQFVESEWGFSIAGKPVISSFKPHIHVSKSGLRFNPLLPLVVGLDPGLTGSAMVFGQQDAWGRLLILGELVQSNFGAQRLISERLKPYLMRRFPGAQLIIAPDPAAANRTMTDERTVVDVFRKHYDVRIESNNRLPLRIDAYDHFLTRLTEAGPAFQIDAEQCPVLVRALKGGWRYVIDAKRDVPRTLDPEKNHYSHPGDAGGYLCRYFHRMTAREQRFGPGGKTFVPPRSFGGSSYHMR